MPACTIIISESIFRARMYFSGRYYPNGKELPYGNPLLRLYLPR